MRLSEYDIDILKSTIRKHIDDGGIMLFGSLIDNNKKGGGIDLFVETD